jgi:hypothetical protein
MKEEFVKYFESIQLPGALGKYINQHISAVPRFYEKDVVDIFLSQKTNCTDYNQLLLISENHLIYILNILNNPEFHIVPLTKAITYLKIIPNKYNFEDSGDEAMLSVSISIAGGELYLEPLIAKGSNCDKLLEITKKYLIPNVVDMVDN